MIYAIWTIPTQPAFNELQQIIKNLATKYHSPIFTPHVTLADGIDQDLSGIQNAVQTATDVMKQLPLSLDPVTFSTTYYQSVFVRVKPTAQLLELNLYFKKLFNLPTSVFMPHISLLYGDHDMSTREKIASGVKLRHARFNVNEIAIIPVKPKPSEWKPIFTIPFGS